MYLTKEQKIFLSEVLESLYESYKKEAKDFDKDEYYAKTEMKISKEIINKLNK
tara:strand:- start:537 stop:695 length:159 start_codon:yes stop_codon:yes gene_type:complete